MTVDLFLLLGVGVVGLLLAGLAVYLPRRRDRRETLKALIASGTPWRPMTSEERAAVAVALRQTGHRDDLARDGVFTLTGPLVSTPGAVTGLAGSTHTLGGVRVFFPWDALEHVSAVNECEVVLTPQAAIVIGLNDSFDIVDAWQRDLEQAQRPPSSTPSSTRVPPPVAPTQGLGQRAESTAEVAARTRSLRWGALLALALALVGSVLASRAPASWQALWATTALLCGLMAAWGLWRPVRLGPPGRVHRLQGPLTWGTAAQGRSPPPFLLGLDRRPLRVPAHWRPMLAECADGARPVELDVRAADHSVVRLSPALSVHEEAKRHPPVFWGRHLIAALAAPLIAGVVWAWSDNLAVDLQQGLRWVGGAQPRTVVSPDSLQAAPPDVGDWVHLKGVAWCEVPRSPPMATRRCDTLRWGGQPPVWPVLTVDEPTQLLSDGSYMQSVSEPFTRRSPLGLPSALAVGQEGVFIRNVPELVLAVEDVCAAQAAAGPSCRDLQNMLRQALQVPSGDAPPDWPAVLAAAQEERLERSLALASLDALKLHALAKEAARPALARAVQASLDALAQSQQGGALLAVRTDRAAHPTATDPADPLKVWESHQPEARLSKPQPFDLLGRVSARSMGSDDPVWTLLLRPTLDPWRTGLPLLWLVVAVVLLTVHGPLAVRGAFQAWRQRRRVHTEAKRRWLLASPPLPALGHTAPAAAATAVPEKTSL
ncbi:MAG: IgaA/UmoB family intracellular growth attenuator [Pseudomonadota bacterium]